MIEFFVNLDVKIVVEENAVKRRTLIPHIKRENKKIDKFLFELFRLYKKYDLCIVQKNRKDPFIISDWAKIDEKWMLEAVDGTKVEPPKQEDKNDEK